MKNLLFIAIAIFGFSAVSFGQKTENTVASANIIVPITLTEVTALNFGTLAVLASTPGTVVLSTAGTRTASGGVNLSSVGTAASNASYNVGGNASTTYAIILPATITVTNGAANMSIGTLLAKPTSAASDALIGTLTSGGIDAFTVGGTLTVPGGQVAGAYSGTFDVTVAYN